MNSQKVTLGDRLLNLDTARLGLFCTTCADRATPLIEMAGTPELVRRWGDWLELVWDSALIPNVDLSDYAHELYSSSQANCLDVNQQEHLVARTLGTMWYALRSMSPSADAENARGASDLMLEITNDLAYAATSRRRKSSLMHLFELEANVQSETISLVSVDSISLAALRDEARELAASHRQIIESLIPAYFSMHGWIANVTRKDGE